MTDRTVTPLYDQALEAVLDDDAMCGREDCTAPAVARFLVPCGCNGLMCPTHRDQAERVRAKHVRETPYVRCDTHAVPRMDPAQIRIHPV